MVSAGARRCTAALRHNPKSCRLVLRGSSAIAWNSIYAAPLIFVG
jgi:hypothetical protein